MNYNEINIFARKKKDSGLLVDNVPLAFAKFQINYDTNDRPVGLTFIEVNHRFESIASRERDQIIGKSLTDVFPELNSTLPEKFKVNEQSLLNFESFEYETFVPSRNKWYDVHVNVQDKYNLTLLFAECTKRKTIEEDLQRSEQNYKSLYDNSPIGLYRTGLDGEIIMANKTLLEILGFESIIDLREFSQAQPLTSEKNKENDLFGLINKGGEISGKEITWKTRNGNIHYLRISSKPIRDDHGKVLFYERTVEDITERTIAGQQIAELNHLFLELGIDAGKNINHIVEKACKIINGMCSLYNRLDEDEKSLVTWAKYNVPADFVHQDAPKGHICYEATFKGKDKPVIIEDLSKTGFVESDPNVSKYGLRSYLGMPVIVEEKTIGSLCVLDQTCRKFTNTEVNIIATLAKALSLEQKRYFTEINLRKAISEATNANQAKSQFMANMSHEIRTPLNAIIGFAEMLSSQEPEERKARILNMIEDSGYQLLSIINDIFDYSRIESGKITLAHEAFKLDQLIKETVGFFDKPFREKGLQWVVNLDRLTENNLLGDVYKLKQILVNVISNALKFTDEGSVMVVAGSIRRGVYADVQIIVEDTGIGISADQVDKVFDEFKQLEYYLTKRIKGTGLGLSITKKLVDLLQGTIHVESEQGRGSRFTLSIPFKIALNPGQQIKEEIMNNSGLIKETITKKVKILLAEDNEANQFLIKAITKSQDWDITVVENGAEAVEKYKSDYFDIILMDVQMPVMNGYEATKIIRQLESEKGIHTPILALTAYAMRSDKDICIESGMDDYISKPFKRQQFLDAINDVLKKIN